MADDKASSQAFKVLTGLAPSEMDKSKLLLLGLNLLNKGLKLPYAVVHPQVKGPAPKPPSQLAEKLKTPLTPHGPPKKQDQIPISQENTRKRKRDPADDLVELDKKEKRWTSD